MKSLNKGVVGSREGKSSGEEKNPCYRSVWGVGKGTREGKNERV